MDEIAIIRLSLAVILVLIVPGAALIAWLPRMAQRDEQPVSATPSATARPGAWSIPMLFERAGAALGWIADAVTLSVSITALVGLGLFVAGVRVGALALTGLYGLMILLGLAAILWGRWVLPGRRALLGGLVAVGFVAALLAWRFLQARGLAFPVWVDSVQHTLMTRVILEYGGIPADLSPYLSAEMVFHFGFHLVTALIAAVADLAPVQAVLWVGQIFNALVSIAVFRAAQGFLAWVTPSAMQAPFQRIVALPTASIPCADAPASGTEFWRVGFVWQAFPWAAALLVTFAFQMPGYYLTWGRYTLLAGLALLGPTLAAAIEIWDQPRRKDAWVRLTMGVAGLSLTHYFALLLMALFLVCLGITGIFQMVTRRERARQYIATLALLAALAASGVLAASPWLVRVWRIDHRATYVSIYSPLQASAAAQQKAAADLNYLEFLLGPRRNQILMVLAGLGGLFALRSHRLRPLVLWTIGIALLMLPWGIRFSPFRPDYFAIVIFFPAGLLLAWLLVDGAAALARVALPLPGWAALALTLALLCAWGARETRAILNPATLIADSADAAALGWVRQNTSPAARFYINSTQWMNGVYRGVDGGYWLLPAAGRFSLVPPALYTWGGPEMTHQINHWAEQAAQLDGCTPAFWQLVRDAQLTHLYLREGKGNLQPDMLADCPRLQVIYQQGGVFVYEIRLPHVANMRAP